MIDNWKIPEQQELNSMRGNIWIPLLLEIEEEDMDRLPLGSFFSDPEWFGNFEYKIRPGRYDKSHAAVDVQIRNARDLKNLSVFLAQMKTKPPGMKRFGIESIKTAREPIHSNLPCRIEIGWATPEFKDVVEIRFVPIVWSESEKEWTRTPGEIDDSCTIHYVLREHEEDDWGDAFFIGSKYETEACSLQYYVDTSNKIIYETRQEIEWTLLITSIFYVLQVCSHQESEKAILEHIDLYQRYYQAYPMGIGPVQDFPEKYQKESDWLG